MIARKYQNFRIIYRRYAGLYFIFGADVTENELLLMETIHLFVELLDQYFFNVCEVIMLSFSSILISNILFLVGYCLSFQQGVRCA